MFVWQCVAAALLCLVACVTAETVQNRHHHHEHYDQTSDGPQRALRPGTEETIFEGESTEDCDVTDSNNITGSGCGTERSLKHQTKRAATTADDEQQPFPYNNDKHLMQHIQTEPKSGRENHLTRFRPVSKQQQREAVNSDDVAEQSKASSKRQPLDRVIDVPNAWRIRLNPKLISGRATAAPAKRFARSLGEWAMRASKRQPLDRVDEPNDWRIKLNPKFVHNRRADKRQPLDRIDEPSDWRVRITPKLNRYGKDIADEDEMAEEDIMAERVEKRQPLDRIDEPSAWRVRLVPKFNHDPHFQLKRITKTF